MAETICPVVDGAKLEGHEGSMLTHIAGATISAALLGAIVGGAGFALGAPWGSAGAVSTTLVAAVALAATFGLPVPAIEGRRQVPEWWRTFFAPRSAAFLYGAALGVGFPFHLRYLTLTAVAVALAATGDPVAGAGTFGLFGLSRGLSVAPLLRSTDVRSERRDLWLNRVVLATMLLAGGAAIVSA